MNRTLPPRVFRLLLFEALETKSSPSETPLGLCLHLGVLRALCQIFCVNFYQKRHNRPEKNRRLAINHKKVRIPASRVY